MSNANVTDHCDKTHYSSQDLDCSSTASNDYYGLGVRIGVYCTWISSWIANLFVPSEIAGALDANAIFLVALMISMFHGSATHTLAYIDGLILMQLCAGYLFGCFSIWGLRTVHYIKEGPDGIRHFGGLGTHFRILIVFAISTYGIWFWTKGIEDGLVVITTDTGGPKPCQCYPLYTFFFARLKVLGGIRYLYIIMTTGTTLYFGSMIIIAGIDRSRHLFDLKRLSHMFENTRYETGFLAPELAFIFRFVSIGNLVWIVFSVISVEMTLNWDFVTEVQSRSHNIGTPSQLLPLLIGLFQFVRIAWLAIRDHFFGGEENAEQIVARTEAVIIKSKARYLVAWLPWLSHFSFWTVARPISVLGNSELGKQSRENGVQEHGGSELPRKEADVSLSPLSPVFGEKEVRF
ncbi:hypothetical protein M433DRAFT_28108 [Acidomyces richmondensis BFW]|nr:hypothetical protein M433DRAFT_28108 [Acidomyces richmondensis BFW]